MMLAEYENALATAQLFGTNSISDASSVTTVRPETFCWSNGLSQATTSETLFAQAGASGFKNLEIAIPSYGDRWQMSAALPNGNSSQFCLCGTRFIDESSFCFRCGAKRETKREEVRGLGFNLEETCTCGNVFMPDAVFCRKCCNRRPLAIRLGGACAEASNLQANYAASAEATNYAASARAFGVIASSAPRPGTLAFVGTASQPTATSSTSTATSGIASWGNAGCNIGGNINGGIANAFSGLGATSGSVGGFERQSFSSTLGWPLAPSAPSVSPCGTPRVTPRITSEGGSLGAAGDTPAFGGCANVRYARPAGGTPVVASPRCPIPLVAPSQMLPAPPSPRTPSASAMAQLLAATIVGPVITPPATPRSNYRPAGVWVQTTPPGSMALPVGGAFGTATPPGSGAPCVCGSLAPPYAVTPHGAAMPLSLQADSLTYAVGQIVEVFRYSGAWTRGTIRATEKSFVAVSLDDGLEMIIFASELKNKIRAVQAQIGVIVPTGCATPPPGVGPVASFGMRWQAPPPGVLARPQWTQPSGASGGKSSSELLLESSQGVFYAGRLQVAQQSDLIPLNNTPSLVTMGGLTYSKGHAVSIGNWQEVLPGMAFLSANAGGLGPTPDGTPIMQLV